MSRCATIVEPSPYPDATSRRDKMLERAMYDPSPSATMQWRRKAGPKIPAADAVREALRAEAGALDFRTLYKQPLGRYYFLMYVRDVAPAQGDFLLGVGRYRSSRLERREIARALLDGHAAAASEIFSVDSLDSSSADASRLSSSEGARRLSGRRAQRAEQGAQVQKAKEMVQYAQARLLSSAPPLDLFDEMAQQSEVGIDQFFTPFKASAYYEQYLQVRAPEGSRARSALDPDPRPAAGVRAERLHGWGRRLPRVSCARRRWLRVGVRCAQEGHGRDLRSEEDG